jgi:hypothetical protein
MTAEERFSMYAICMLMQNEKDPKKFNCLVEELDRLLNTKRESHPSFRKAALGESRNFKT